jgi:hypothetical protein
MCELLVRIEDKSSDPDPVRDRMLSKKGHVIDIRPDGWPWTQAELTNPAWRVGSVPGVTPEDYVKFAGAVVDRGPLAMVQIARKAFYLDVDQLAAKLMSSRAGALASFTSEEIDAATIATVVPSPVPVIG